MFRWINLHLVQLEYMATIGAGIPGFKLICQKY